MLRRSQKNLRSHLSPRSSVREDDDKESLRQKRKQKQKRFAWLAKFLRSGRPTPGSLEDRGILSEYPSLKQLLLSNDFFSHTSYFFIEQPQVSYFGVPISEIYTNPDLLTDNVPKPLILSAKELMNCMYLFG